MAIEERTTTYALRLARNLKAPRDKVFRAWTTPEELKRWSAPGDYTNPLVEVDLRVGGRFRIHMRAPNGAVHQATGVYREVDPPRKLVYTWLWEEDPSVRETLVTVEFHERGGSTEVVLTHDLFPSEEARAEHEKGWAGCLEKLATAL